MISEKELAAELKSGIIRPIYFLYGEENFLTKTYVEKIKNKLFKNGNEDFNLIQLSNPTVAELSVNVESLPVFAEKKLVMVNDLNPEKLDIKTLDGYIDVLSDIPNSSVVLIYITGFEISKKPATKKLLALIEKNGAVCEFNALSIMKIADLIVKKAIKQKRLISQSNAEYLAEITQSDVMLASEETAKLCSYVSEGDEITRQIIDKCVAKRLDTSIFNLSTAIMAKKTMDALIILDEFYQQRFEPTLITSTLAGAYIDMYHAKLAKNAGISADKAVEAFGIKKNRAWIITKLYGQISRIDISSIRNCISIVSDVDIKLKSTMLNSRTVLEKAIIELTRH